MKKPFIVMTTSFMKIKSNTGSFVEIEIITDWYSDGTKKTREVPGKMHIVPWVFPS